MYQHPEVDRIMKKIRKIIFITLLSVVAIVIAGIGYFFVPLSNPDGLYQDEGVHWYIYVKGKTIFMIDIECGVVIKEEMIRIDRTRFTTSTMIATGDAESITSYCSGLKIIMTPELSNLAKNSIQSDSRIFFSGRKLRDVIRKIDNGELAFTVREQWGVTYETARINP